MLAGMLPPPCVRPFLVMQATLQLKVTVAVEEAQACNGCGF